MAIMVVLMVALVMVPVGHMGAGFHHTSHETSDTHERDPVKPQPEQLPATQEHPSE